MTMLSAPFVLVPRDDTHVSGYMIAVTCGHCGGELVHEATFQPSNAESSALAKCSACHREWQVWVRLLAVVNPASARRQKLREKERSAVAS